VSDGQIDSGEKRYISVGFVAAAVSMPMGGCRAKRPVVDMSVTVEPAVL